MRTWGLTAGAAVVGALTISAVAKGILAVVATLANPPVALTTGALAGGVLGWTFMQKPATATETVDETVATEAVVPATTDGVVMTENQPA